MGFFSLVAFSQILSTVVLASPLGSTTERPGRRESIEASHSFEIKDLKKAHEFASSFPFTRIVAFGDDYTDNGEGSYAAGITGDNQTGSGSHLWGNNTWTDGPVAVTWLSDQLGIPISYDFAYGSSAGAQFLGSVCDNNLIPNNQQSSHAHLNNGQLVPSALDQVNNYTNSGNFDDDIKDTLHFFWTGNNDVIASLGWTGRFTICDTDNDCSQSQQNFTSEVSNCMQSGLESLLQAGANYILIPNIYPRNLSPWTTMWISKEQGMIDDFGTVIDNTNKALQQSISELSTKYPNSKLMYYDANSWMKSAMNESSISGCSDLGNGFSYTCVDSCTEQNPTGTSNWNLYWNDTVLDHKPDDFFWMTEIMASSTVHKSMANDMAQFLQQQMSANSTA